MQAFDPFYYTNYGNVLKSQKILNLIYLIYSTTVYNHHYHAEYTIKNFIIQLLYFISNFLCRIPQSSIGEANKIVSYVPKSKKLIDIHLRFQFPGQFYSYSIERTMNMIRGCVQERVCDSVFAFASDSADMEAAFYGEFGRFTINSDAIGRSDFDYYSDLIDIALLMNCDECLLSYRSTFSYALHQGWAKNIGL